LLRKPPVNIRFISTLTAEDENHLAPGILKAVAALAEMFPIRFVVRLDTADGQTYYAGNPGGGNHGGTGQNESPGPFVSRASPIES
jgi:hypothetical protein